MHITIDYIADVVNKTTYNSKYRIEKFERIFNLIFVTEQHEENLYYTIARYINTYYDKSIVIQVKDNLRPPFTFEINSLRLFWDNYAKWLGISRENPNIYEERYHIY